MLFKEMEQKIRSIENQKIICKYRAFQNSIELLDRNFHMLGRLLIEVENMDSEAFHQAGLKKNRKEELEKVE